ncbi:hypothetical protein F4780DRAFT_769771 [Xylariomycetidae sp. FL0641]|nr:hypothetical protein F4780DRAFT_769771 [Xylariomycetidae sp. FL0641]
MASAGASAVSAQDAAHLSPDNGPPNGIGDGEHSGSEDSDSESERSTQQPSDEQDGLEDATFDEFVRTHKEKSIQLSSDAMAKDDSTRSVAWLVRDAEGRRIIATPREYQVELFERAKEKNTIAVMDTGTGKTLIAALLLRHTIHQELEDREAGMAPRMSFFLVDKVALVFQQYMVLKANLDHPVAKFHGDLANSSLNNDFWEQQQKSNMVIVCTADILHTCLHRSFIKMEAINLLIFDEAHHAKKNHPYARIIKDFYAELKKADQRRPRILGMTASPVDAKVDVATAAAQLEGLLQSEIATVSDMAAFRKASINRPTEEVIEYSKIPDPFETPLWHRLHKLVGHNATFRKLFIYSRECTTELGRWCADRVWQINFTTIETQKAEAKTQRDFNYFMRPISDLDAERAAVEEAHQIIVNHSFADAELNPLQVSNKVMMLVTALRQTFNPETDKCIIFVEQRLTARILTDLFKQPGMGLAGINPGMLVLTMHQFRHGELNCIFSTSVGEEGIDIPDCNFIIRFDLCKTMIQYIQSRGRARRQDSRFLNMVEIANTNQIQSIWDHEDNETRLRDLCQTLPEDRLVTGADYHIDYFLSREKSHRSYVVASTGAKLTYKSSLSVLAEFTDSLPQPSDAHYRAEYIVQKVGEEFECEVLLPPSSPIKCMIGRRATSKQVAKCSAAFEMCVKLRQQRHLNEWLQTTFIKRLPAMRNAQLALSSKKKSGYPMRIKPNLWTCRGIPTRMYLTIFRLSSPETLDRPSKPIALLTREAVPRLARFPLFFGKQCTSDVECIPLLVPIGLDPSAVHGLNEFTLRIFKDVFSKEYKSDPEKMPYLIAPVIHPHDYDFTNVIDSQTVIDWACISTTEHGSEYLDWEDKPCQVLESKFVIDPHDGSRKFYTDRCRPDLKPTDDVLQTAGMGQHLRKILKHNIPKNIWNFSVSLWSKSRARIEMRDDLTVVEAEFIPLRRNLLDEFDQVEIADRKCYLVFQTLKISLLPTEVVAMAYTLPAIIYRLESNLVALDACKMLQLEISPELALEAVTKNSDNTEDHSETQVNYQGGMGNNYERLEFLGDSFLKMGTTISLFSQIPESDEYQYHVDRMLMICNKNLFNNALDMNLEEYIRSKKFNRRTWYPDGLELLKGKQNTSILGKKGVGSDHHILADKSIADVCEALIGASYLTTHDEKNFDMAVRAVTIFVKHKHHKMTSWSDYYAAYEIPEWQSAESTAVQRDLARQMEEQFGYKFTYPRLLRSAFVHPSYGSLYERVPHYQRLEFLGDALLDMVCVDFLFHRFPDADPQWLTEHKMAMVSNQFLGCLCVSLGLQKHMLSMTGGLQQEIMEYVNAITDARTKAEDEAEANGLGRRAYARNFWVDESRPPKALPDIVEAFIGAIFVDSKYNYGQVQDFFDTHIRPYFDDMHQYDTFANKHPATFLSNLLSIDFHCASWRLRVQELEQDGEDKSLNTESNVMCCVVIHGRVREHAVAASGRYAKAKAASRMARTLKDMSFEQFRSTYKCDCSPKEVEKVDLLKHATAI